MKKYATAVTLLSLVAIAGMLGTGCERSRFEIPGVPGVPSAGGVSGTWNGTVTVSAGGASETVQTSLKLQQSGSSVTGTMGSGFTVSGTLVGAQLSLNLTGSSGVTGKATFTHSGNSLLNGSGYLTVSGGQATLTFSTLTRA